MDILELGAIGELVGGAAVLVTLIYLAVQIRQNRLSSQSTVYDGTVNAWLGVLRPKTENMDLFIRGGKDYTGLRGEEALKFSMVTTRIFGYLENGFSKWRSGLMPNVEEWERVGRILVWYLSMPGIGKEWWPESRSYYTAAFAAHVDGVLARLEEGALERFDHSHWL